MFLYFSPLMLPMAHVFPVSPSEKAALVSQATNMAKSVLRAKVENVSARTIGASMSVPSYLMLPTLPLVRDRKVLSYVYHLCNFT